MAVSGMIINVDTSIEPELIGGPSNPTQTSCNTNNNCIQRKGGRRRRLRGGSLLNYKWRCFACWADGRLLSPRLYVREQPAADSFNHWKMVKGIHCHRREQRESVAHDLFPCRIHRHSDLPERI
jgi:hypothetical protein